MDSLTASEGGLVLTTDSSNSFVKSDSFDDTNRLLSSVDAAQTSSSTRYNFFCNVLSASLFYNKFQLNAVTNTDKYYMTTYNFHTKTYILDKYIMQCKIFSWHPQNSVHFLLGSI